MGSEPLENVWTDVLPGVPLPATAANFIFARIEWIRQGESGTFLMEAPSPWKHSDLCTLAFLIAGREISSATLMVTNLLQPPSTLLHSSTLVYQNDNYLKSRPLRRRRKQKRRKFASSGCENTATLQVLAALCFTLLCQAVYDLIFLSFI